MLPKFIFKLLINFEWIKDIDTLLNIWYHMVSVFQRTFKILIWTNVGSFWEGDKYTLWFVSYQLRCVGGKNKRCNH